MTSRSTAAPPHVTPLHVVTTRSSLGACCLSDGDSATSFYKNTSVLSQLNPLNFISAATHLLKDVMPQTHTHITQTLHPVFQLFGGEAGPASHLDGWLL